MLLYNDDKINHMFPNLKILLTGQEALAKHMEEDSLKNEEEALYASKCEGNSSNMTMVDRKKMMTSQKIIKAKGAFVEGEV